MLQLFFIQIEKLDKQMTDLIPLEKHGERCLLRDKRLAALAKLKKNLKESEWKMHMPSDNICWTQLLF